ncbi:assimilatory sulfite reductase (NADPH) flavoprotein subunit [Ferrimonas sp. SCSIO 43195]|uniref:assimilatory sulfite reductase (NADPH) flavoprotein subunit n=1 Tax=Ferrimonas sp. SCSIO 43195 TaxID=2822844 RepID=UPI00207661D3|nr:assimilatory sulfite reductase (NADPH) flavoprotein subunit [Ferrimonas sp. SCSIO 43195]USD37008.1 assimilatory sulfite reductase (NADPH) flavoprotein subunit [Ferrimonas sp. SCSIO 43195]
MQLQQLQQGAGGLSQEQLTQLQQLASGLSPVQLAWVSGYLAAFANQGAAGQSPAEDQPPSSSLTILYGSQTGNSRSLASALAQQAQSQGRVVKLVSMADYKPRQLKEEQQLLVLVSTHGEGDPPDDAMALHKFLHSARAPKLPQLSYSVLALGDSSYDNFCQTGLEFDQRLHQLGARRLLERADCDVDFEDTAAQWQAQVLERLATVSPATGAAVASAPPAQASGYSRSTPFESSLLLSQKITGRGSVKDTRHVELSLEGSGLSYQPGDALGVWMSNDPELVEALLRLLALEGEQQVEVKDQTLSLRQALTDHYELTLLHPALVGAWAEFSGSEALAAIVADRDQLKTFIGQHQLIDLAQRYPASVDAEALLATLRKLTPRLYSIASSQAEVDEEVHLTVALVEEERDGHVRQGTVSGAFAHRLQEGDGVRVYVEANDNFRLPSDDTTPVIMIGPGTGVAPFRAFLQERDARGAQGQNWLFFGNPTFTEDFLYQLEWQGYVKSGLLTHISLAFSRDQQQKIYVQDRIREQGAELYQWLQRGAHLYLCGDANRMAADVEQALIDVVAQHGGLSVEAAQDYLSELRSSKRYQKDVY